MEVVGQEGESKPEEDQYHTGDVFGSCFLTRCHHTDRCPQGKVGSQREHDKLEPDNQVGTEFHQA